VHNLLCVPSGRSQGAPTGSGGPARLPGPFGIGLLRLDRGRTPSGSRSSAARRRPSGRQWSDGRADRAVYTCGPARHRASLERATRVHLVAPRRPWRVPPKGGRMGSSTLGAGLRALLPYDVRVTVRRITDMPARPWTSRYTSTAARRGGAGAALSRVFGCSSRWILRSKVRAARGDSRSRATCLRAVSPGGRGGHRVAYQGQCC